MIQNETYYSTLAMEINAGSESVSLHSTITILHVKITLCYLTRL